MVLYRQAESSDCLVVLVHCFESLMVFDGLVHCFEALMVLHIFVEWLLHSLVECSEWLIV
jgi:hypothetical protein